MLFLLRMAVILASAWAAPEGSASFCELILREVPPRRLEAFEARLNQGRFGSHHLLLTLTVGDDGARADRAWLLEQHFKKHRIPVELITPGQFELRLQKFLELDSWWPRLRVVLPLLSRVSAEWRDRPTSGFRWSNELPAQYVLDAAARRTLADIEAQFVAEVQATLRAVIPAPSAFPADRGSAPYYPDFPSHELRLRGTTFLYDREGPQRRIDIALFGNPAGFSALRYGELFSRVARALDVPVGGTQRMSLVHVDGRPAVGLMTFDAYAAAPADLNEIERILVDDPALKARLEILGRLTGVKFHPDDFRVWWDEKTNRSQLMVWVENLDRIVAGMLDDSADGPLELSAVPKRFLDKYRAEVRQLRFADVKYGITLTEHEISKLQDRARACGLEEGKNGE